MTGRRFAGAAADTAAASAVRTEARELAETRRGHQLAFVADDGLTPDMFDAHDADQAAERARLGRRYQAWLERQARRASS
jgi:hypothetical protein